MSFHNKRPGQQPSISHVSFIRLFRRRSFVFFFPIYMTWIIFSIPSHSLSRITEIYWRKRLHVNASHFLFAFSDKWAFCSKTSGCELVTLHITTIIHYWRPTLFVFASFFFKFRFKLFLSPSRLNMQKFEVHPVGVKGHVRACGLGLRWIHAFPSALLPSSGPREEVTAGNTNQWNKKCFCSFSSFDLLLLLLACLS